MIAAVIAGVASISMQGGIAQPTALAPKEACHVAATGKSPSDRAYSIAGTYLADGMHGATFELPNCDAALSPLLEDAALARTSDFHENFRRKCGIWLRGDYIVGSFTGHFERRPIQLFGMSAPSQIDLFVITAIETKDEDPASITCPK